MPAFDDSYYSTKELFQIHASHVRAIEQSKARLIEIEAEIARRGPK